MKIYETLKGVLPVDKVVEYFESIQKDYEFAETVEGSIRNRFLINVRETYEKAENELSENEKRVLDKILIANDIDILVK